jgi:hypothetical protein
MTPEQFAIFMQEQAEYFREIHGDCEGLTAEQISEDSLTFRKKFEQKEKT